MSTLNFTTTIIKSMKERIMKVAWFVLIGAALVACQTKKQETTVDLKTKQDTVSYYIGTDIGKNLKSQGIVINTEALGKGVADATAGTMIFNEEQLQKIGDRFRADVTALRDSLNKIKAEKGKKEGEEFLAANKKRDSVVTLPSGLQYKVVAMGKGKKPTAEQTVTVNYRGTLVDGTEFENSYKRGQPATYPVHGFCKGWVEALQLMPEGSHWMLYVPPDLGYGDQGAGAAIPPGATLIFEVELLSIK